MDSYTYLLHSLVLSDGGCLYVHYSIVKHSLQGTTQGNGGNYQIHHPPLVVKGYAVPCVEAAGNLADLFRADGFYCQRRYLCQKFLLASVPFGYLHIHIRDQHIVCDRQTVHQLFNLALVRSPALVMVSRSGVTAHFPNRGIPFQTVIRFQVYVYP